ncbi:MAG TPA: gephyrin-like molybdotransferase Glp [Gemmatimonadaceae bacterium]|nr:gephyrin-like molybdotransferase Glp [Gemmatimonadaceae bacterium]
MLTVPEASAEILAAIQPLAPERVALLDALGRVLVTPAVASYTLPHWDNSAMDGYAVRGEDIAGATEAAPVVLRVLETVAAGQFANRPVGPGEATRIMTGAPMPEGADSVVRVEDTDGGLERVAILRDRDAGRNVRPRGEDFRESQVVIDAGTPLAAAQLGVLASLGMASVDVYRRPVVAIAGSGDELVDLDRFHEVLEGHRIVASNSYTLSALVRSAGGVPLNLGNAGDTPESLRAVLERSRGADLLVTSAGASVGEFDYTRAVLESLGAELRFWRVRMRPGAPLGFGVLHGMPWIGLPGNPVSAMVTFELFVRPVIRRLLGHTRLFRRPVPVVLEEPVTIGARLTHFLRAVLRVRPDGVLTARLTGPQGSGILTSMARANALLVVPDDRPRTEAGDQLHALPLSDDAELATAFSL